MILSRVLLDGRDEHLRESTKPFVIVLSLKKKELSSGMKEQDYLKPCFLNLF